MKKILGVDWRIWGGVAAAGALIAFGALNGAYAAEPSGMTYDM